MTDPAPIGHNAPPKFDALSLALDDARDTAKDFLDGTAIDHQGQADAIGKIVSEVKKLRKAADDARKEEKEPHLAASRATDAKWKPLDEKAANIITAVSKPLTEWLSKEAARQAREAQEARDAANAKQEAAINAQRASAGNLEAVEAAADLQKEADAALKVAARAEKAKPQVAGLDRAIGLRSRRVAEVTDYRALLDWLTLNDRPALEAFMDEYAQRKLAALPGVEIHTERSAA